jgi:hypothetical protein
MRGPCGGGDDAWDVRRRRLAMSYSPDLHGVGSLGCELMFKVFILLN